MKEKDLGILPLFYCYCVTDLLGPDSGAEGGRRFEGTAPRRMHTNRPRSQPALESHRPPR